ncbi:MAG: hypothetical protein HZB68_02810 [Candidatus Aenigmarchaeota archaeon]|nr:hypothetical protein [Candidatus Aenigmarchaeota archaeon]
MDLNETAGWYGVIALLMAYGLVSFSLIQSNSVVYHLLNFTGALGIIAISLKRKNYQPVALNVIWGVIALIALARLVLRV